jgi:hypothetical protein
LEWNGCLFRLVTTAACLSERKEVRCLSRFITITVCQDASLELSLSSWIWVNWISAQVQHYSRLSVSQGSQLVSLQVYHYIRIFLSKRVTLISAQVQHCSRLSVSLKASRLDVSPGLSL